LIVEDEVGSCFFGSSVCARGSDDGCGDRELSLRSVVDVDVQPGPTLVRAQEKQRRTLVPGLVLIGHLDGEVLDVLAERRARCTSEVEIRGKS
jgi:hypothetical protein